MEDPKVIAAIITATIALFLGLANLIFNIIALKKRNINEKEIEKLKSQLEIEKIEFEESLRKEENETTIKMTIHRRILNALQVLKDGSYSLINNLPQNDELYLKGLENFNKSLDLAIGVYQETYMDIEGELRKEIHEIKNILHYTKIEVENEFLEISNEMKNNKRIDKKVMLNLIEKITGIQQNILN